MSLLKDVISDFLLFSLIEGYIFCLFFEKIGGCNKFKWYEIFILSFGNCIISQIFPPIVYQIIGIFYMSLFLYKTNKELDFIYCVKILLYANCFLIIIEMTATFLYDNILNIKAYKNLKTIKLLFITLPIKILEIFLINKKRGSIMKWFMGEIKR